MNISYAIDSTDKMLAAAYAYFWDCSIKSLGLPTRDPCEG